MNHLESRMIGGINSSMQNRIALVDERFISKASDSLIAGTLDPDCPCDRSAKCFPTQFCMNSPASDPAFPAPRKNFYETDSLAVDWFFAGRKWLPPDVFLCHERLRRSNWFGSPT
jgi:hypothetical protein